MENQETAQEIWERVYFKEGYGNPYLFYVLFGTDKMDNLSVSKSKHNIDGIPDELEIINYNKAKDVQKAYIEGFYMGPLKRTKHRLI